LSALQLPPHKSSDFSLDETAKVKETTSLYKMERKIEKQASMMKIIHLLRQGKRDEAKSLIKRYKKYAPVAGIKA
jgi:hypothetical protein